MWNANEVEVECFYHEDLLNKKQTHVNAKKTEYTHSIATVQNTSVLCTAYCRVHIGLGDEDNCVPRDRGPSRCRRGFAAFTGHIRAGYTQGCVRRSHGRPRLTALVRYCCDLDFDSLTLKLERDLDVLKRNHRPRGGAYSRVTQHVRRDTERGYLAEFYFLAYNLLCATVIISSWKCKRPK